MPVLTVQDLEQDLKDLELVHALVVLEAGAPQRQVEVADDAVYEVAAAYYAAFDMEEE